MKIYNTTTGKYCDLSIIGKNGIEYTADLIGGQGDLYWNDNLDCNEGNQDYIDWWADIIEKLELIDELISDIKQELAPDEIEIFEYDMYQLANVNDLECHAAALIPFLQRFKENLNK